MKRIQERIKITLVKNVETGEYVSKVYFDNKYSEAHTNYTDNLQDAIATTVDIALRLGLTITINRLMTLERLKDFPVI